MAYYSDFWFDFIDQKHFFNQTRDGESDILLYNSFLELHYLHYKMGQTSKTSNKRSKNDDGFKCSNCITMVYDNQVSCRGLCNPCRRDVLLKQLEEMNRAEWKETGGSVIDGEINVFFNLFGIIIFISILFRIEYIFKWFFNFKIIFVTCRVGMKEKAEKNKEKMEEI